MTQNISRKDLKNLQVFPRMNIENYFPEGEERSETVYLFQFY